MTDLIQQQPITPSVPASPTSSALPESAAPEMRLCLYCSQPLTPVRREHTFQSQKRLTWHWPSRHGCALEIAALAQEDTDRKAQISRQNTANHQAAMRSAGLTGLLSGYTFMRYSLRQDWPGTAEVHESVWRYAQAIAYHTYGARPWLVLHGNYGTGKSHLSAAVIRHLIDSGWSDCYFRVWTSYVARLQATMDKHRASEDEFGHETQADIMAELKRGRVVVIDDIDKQPASEWARAKLFDVLNTRYNALAPTVLTFNTSIEDRQIQDYVGAAVLDRIMQHAFDVVAFDGPSYRMVMA